MFCHAALRAFPAMRMKCRHDPNPPPSLARESLPRNAHGAYPVVPSGMTSPASATGTHLISACLRCARWPSLCGPLRLSSQPLLHPDCDRASGGRGAPRPSLSSCQGFAKPHGRWPSPGLSRERERRFAAADPSLRSSVPLHPACRPFISFRSTPFHSFHRPVPRSGGTLIRAYPARAGARVGAGAVRAPDCPRPPARG